MLKKWIEIAVLIMGTLGFWGFVYPELTLTEDIYIAEKADIQEGHEISGEAAYREPRHENGDMCLQIGELRIKSKVLEYILAEDKRVGCRRISDRKKEKPKG